MNKAKYTSLLARPQDISKEDIKELTTIIDAFPYFQSARALQLKGLKIENSFLYNDALKKTAAYTTDRDVLFDYITSNVFIQDEISEMILQNIDAIKEIEVVSENLSEATSLEIDRQLKSEIKKAEAILDPELFERKKKEPVTKSSETAKIPAKEPVIHPDEPLHFTKDETHSFTEWLKITKAVPIDREIEAKDSTSIQQPKGIDRKFELIEKFIQERPKLKPKEAVEKIIDLSEPYTKTSESLMTETLARVYLQQKNYPKAIQAYKILILKNPEKSGFFADQIRAIQKLIKE